MKDVNFGKTSVLFYGRSKMWQVLKSYKRQCGVVAVFMLSIVSLLAHADLGERVSIKTSTIHDAAEVPPISEEAQGLNVSPSPKPRPIKTLRLSLPNLDNKPEAVNELIRRIHDAMMAEFNVAIEPVYTPWIRRNVMMTRGEADLTVKSHATNYEKLDPNVVRVDVPVLKLDDIKITYNFISDKNLKTIGVLRGTLHHDTYCEKYRCVLANSEDQLIDLLMQRRVESIVVLEILLTPQLDKLKGIDLRYEKVFTHNVHVYFIREHSGYKKGLEKQLSQYWK